MQNFAALSGVDPSTLSRYEAAGKKPISAKTANLLAVLEALQRAGVEITEDGLKLVKPRR